MSNAIERHPFFSLLGVFITTAGATWVLLTFILDDNKINFYNAQLENAKSEINNCKTLGELYKSRIDYLEKENILLKETNSLYLSEIEKSKNPILFFKSRLEELSKENHQIKSLLADSFKSNLIIKDTTNPSKPIEKYFVSKDISSGEAFVDEKSGIVIGVSQIDVYKKADVHVTYSNGSKKDETVYAGHVYTFTSKNKAYTLVISKIEFVYGYITIQIREK